MINKWVCQKCGKSSDTLCMDCRLNQLHKLPEKEIKTLFTVARLKIEAIYKGKLDDDNYFKRGFLLACQELTDEFVKVLNEYEVFKKGE
jgi:hypothetical protein